ncbi:divalent-cation tolerance protein CutA [Veronia pacifica]|uniref:Cytochrome C biogenesis protein n=1 Tax=Veronia pacifica TaxID=1080227 RepID=A0A1C3ESQ1_9GAMM|nr:divalent-cation tolerance protein CutA [Veronia pacifica]ODA36215.1 hypothetical protein A8L45_01015 [Veronia pacifica]
MAKNTLPSDSEKFAVVFTTYSDDAMGKLLIHTLLEEKWAACIQVYPVQSFYNWQGEIQSDDEKLVLIKTRRALFDGLCARILSLHSYEVPEIVMLPVMDGAADYLEWIKTNCRQA